MCGTLLGRFWMHRSYVPWCAAAIAMTIKNSIIIAKGSDPGHLEVCVNMLNRLDSHERARLGWQSDQLR